MREKKFESKHAQKSKNTDSTNLHLPEGLPLNVLFRFERIEEKICPETGKPLVKIGEDVTQMLAHRSGSYFIKEIIRPKYAKMLLLKTSEEGVSQHLYRIVFCHVVKLMRVFLADILVKKFADHLPLYRQSEMFAREGITINSSNFISMDS